MEYQKIINLLENTPNQPSKFRTKSWVEVNDESRGIYSVNSEINFKTSMLRSSLCDYSDAYILASTTIAVPNTAAANNRKNIIIKNCTPFTNCISEINNTQLDNAKDINIVMPMYNLIEYTDNYSQTSGNLWHYNRDEPFLNANGDITDFSADNNNSASFKFKTKIAGKIEESDDTKNVKIRVPLKYFSNFWRALEIALINCEINLILTWSNKCFIIDSPIEGQKPIDGQDNAKLLEQFKSGFKITINWNKYEPKVKVERQKQYLDFLINPSFRGVNRLFVLSFENTDGTTGDIIFHL